MARSENNLKAVLQDTADAIRAKDGSSAKICPRDFADRVNAIPTGPEPTGEIEISEPFTKVDVADKEFAYTNNDYGMMIIVEHTSNNCSLRIVGRNDTHYSEPLYVEQGCNVWREYDPTQEISEDNDPYLFEASRRCSYYVYSDGSIVSKFNVDQIFINQPSDISQNRLALVLDCIYNPSFIPSRKEIRFNFSVQINIHHPNCSFEEAISMFGDYVDIVDLTGDYIKKNVPINEVVTTWKDNDSSGSTSINSDEYSY